MSKADIEEAKKALEEIDGHLKFVRDYLHGDFAEWYNTVVKTRKRMKVVKANCDVITKCMNNIAKERGEED